MIKTQANQDRKPRKRATIQSLPDGANDDNAWTRLVVPNFIHLIMAGEQPWFISDDDIISDLQEIWNHVYGRRVQFEVKKGTVPFDLVSFLLFRYSFLFSLQAVQKLYDYRSKIATQGVNVVFTYLYYQRANQDDEEMEPSELAQLAKGLLANRDQFIFKGMENIHRVSQNWIG
jgi:hypothetical protein